MGNLDSAPVGIWSFVWGWRCRFVGALTCFVFGGAVLFCALFWLDLFHSIVHSNMINGGLWPVINYNRTKNTT